MDNKLLGVDIIESTDHLFEEVLGIVLLELAALSDVTEEVATLAEFHYEAHMLTGLKRIIQLDDVLVCTLLQDAHLLHQSALVFLFIAQHGVLDRLDGYQVL